LEKRKNIEIDAYQQSRRLIRIARNSEAVITKNLLSISSSLGTEMGGLDYRLKTVESLARKIKNEPNAKLRDVLRYTIISSPQSQVDSYFKMIDELQKKGYTISAVKNDWSNSSNPYNGINTNIFSPNGYEFEVQFHNHESFTLKNGKLHEIYERQRILDPIKDVEEYRKLYDEMWSLSNGLRKPKNIEKI